VAGVFRSAGQDASRFLLQVAGARVRLRSLLDTSHLVDVVDSLIDWTALHRNVQRGLIPAVAVATTAAATQGTVIFVEKHRSVRLPPPDERRDITYVETELTAEHAVASASIPVLFRPVRVGTPEPWRGWYVDGGVRLNAPIKPALDLGADRLAVVATHPAWYPAPAGPPPAHHGRVPDIVASAAHVLRGALADRMVEDLRTLGKVNALVTGRQGRGYREIPFVFAGPGRDQGAAIGLLAEREFRAHISGAGALRNPELWLLSRLICGAHADHGDVLSYLFFEPAFTRPAAKLGAEHAEHAGGWRVSL
jgi:NTE family protein